MRRNLKLLGLTEVEDQGVHTKYTLPPRNWPDLDSGFQYRGELRKRSGAILQISELMTDGKRSWEGEESPVSVIGHAARSNNVSSNNHNNSSNFNMMQLATSHLSSGSTSMEHPPSNDSAASDYAALLSERVQQAFRKSHELQTHTVKTWPTSANSKRMEWLNLPEDPPFIATSELSKVFRNLKSRGTDAVAAPSMDMVMCPKISHGDDRQAARSEEDTQSIIDSTTKTAGQYKTEDEAEEDSVIDFFPAMNRSGSAVQSQTRKGEVFNPKVQECKSVRPATGVVSLGNVSMSRRRPRSSDRGGGGAAFIYQNYVADDENNVNGCLESGARVSTSSYKWDDAERWLTASPSTTCPASSSASGPLHPQLQPRADNPLHLQTRKTLSDPASTQDKHVAEGRCHANPLDAATRESSIQFEQGRKRDIATQSTPAEWSGCDSPELECAITFSPPDRLERKPCPSTVHRAGPEYVSTGVDIEAARAQKTSPPRHNTPARRSVSCSRSRYNSHDLMSSNMSAATGKLNLRDLESCHRDKLKLEQEYIPLGTAATWQLSAEEEDGQAKEYYNNMQTMSSSEQRLLVEARKSPATGQYSNLMADCKMNMMEARVSAWEDVERAKHIAKFKRDEAKIEAWESLQRAEADAELRKLEVKLEKIRFEGREKIMAKLEATQKRAQEMRSTVESQKAEQLTRVAVRANHIRKSGHFPSSAFHVMCSLTTKKKPISNLSFS